MAVGQPKPPPSPPRVTPDISALDHYAAVIRGLDEPPIVIDHSFGGLITMLLLDRGLGASAVAISPAQPKGVLTLPPAKARVPSVALRNPANRHSAPPLR